jgi:ABC-type phosphate transport system substrate-binding protein
MKKQLCAIAAAVAATLGASSAFAITPLGPFTVTLTVSGSSAFQAAFESELSRVGSSICANGTVAVPALSYNKFQSSTNDFRAYTCNLAGGVLSAGGGEPAAIYYRGEGGSVTGLRPLLAGGPQIKRLLLSNCPVPASGSTTTNTCTISGYVSSSDAVTSGLENAVSELGFADEEPAVFTGENYPTAATFAFLQPALTATERTTLNGAAVSVVAQAFGIYVNTTDADLSAVTSLSRNTLGNIFKGTYSDWNTVPNDATGQPVTNGSLPIRLCRREAGSGTQTATSIFFNATSGFASEANPQALAVTSGGGGVVENTSSGSMRTCINGNTGAIGFISSEADVTGRHQIQIDGKGTSIAETGNNLGTAIATGDYDFWYEMVAIKRPGLGGAANTLASKLISVSQLQASGPTTANIAFLSGPNAAAYPLVPVAGKQPISCVRRNKDSKSIAFWQC